MDGSSNAQSSGLEDQIRNMILSGTSPPLPTQHTPQQPTVRLPPNAPYQRDQPAPTAFQNWRQQNVAPVPQQRQPPVGQHGGFNRGPMRGAPQQMYGRQSHGPLHQQQPVDPNAFQRRAPPNFSQQPQQRRQLYQPDSRGPSINTQPHWRVMQADYMESIAAREVPLVEMSQAERDEKDAFRKELEAICKEVCNANPERLPKVSIECFGSLQSDFASTGSDMDLVTVVQDGSAASACFSLFEDDLPRALELRLLQKGYGAHLLTRTRVPIIKVCEKPASNLLSRLRAEREKWDSLPNEQKYPHLHKEDDEPGEEDMGKLISDIGGTHASTSAVSTSRDSVPSAETQSTLAPAEVATPDQNATPSNDAEALANTIKLNDGLPKPKREPWTRERKAGPLDFPKSGVGIQSDINFFNPLGIHNTQLLRCYSLCDPRVRPMILFVKSWAKRRKVNSSYSGTLSSYGYVLMVLHYLMNVARPAVIPNLQQAWRPNAHCTPQGADAADVDGVVVDFWRREAEITAAVHASQMTSNREPLGSLLAGFFQYFSSQGGYPSFHWMGEVLSLRTPGGLQTKEEKGWVKAVTEQGEGKQVQHRYLFAIEDPFELTHNVARTVTHNGIVAIRDEFRRAYRILRAISNNQVPRDGELFDEMVEVPPEEQGVSVGNAAHPFVPPPPGALRQAGRPQQQRPEFSAPGFAVPKPLDVKNNDAFPALGPARSALAPKGAGEQKKQGRDFGGEISGERARIFLEELRRKRAEEAAGRTASGVAESVLGP